MDLVSAVFLAVEIPLAVRYAAHFRARRAPLRAPRHDNFAESRMQPIVSLLFLCHFCRIIESGPGHDRTRDAGSRLPSFLQAAKNAGIRDSIQCSRVVTHLSVEMLYFLPPCGRLSDLGGLALFRPGLNDQGRVVQRILPLSRVAGMNREYPESVYFGLLPLAPMVFSMCPSRVLVHARTSVRNKNTFSLRGSETKRPHPVRMLLRSLVLGTRPLALPNFIVHRISCACAFPVSPILLSHYEDLSHSPAW